MLLHGSFNEIFGEGSPHQFATGFGGRSERLKATPQRVGALS